MILVPSGDSISERGFIVSLPSQTRLISSESLPRDKFELRLGSKLVLGLEIGPRRLNQL